MPTKLCFDEFPQPSGYHLTMSRKRRGYSLMELVTVLAIVGISAGIALPNYREAELRSEARHQVDRLAGDISMARLKAMSGWRPSTGWQDSERTAQAGIRFVSAQEYVLFVDNNSDSSDQGEVVFRRVMLPDRYALNFVDAELRFKRNGLQVEAKDQRIGLEDQLSSLQRWVEVSYGGQVKTRDY